MTNDTISKELVSYCNKCNRWKCGTESKCGCVLLFSHTKCLFELPDATHTLCASSEMFFARNYSGVCLKSHTLNWCRFHKIERTIAVTLKRPAICSALLNINMSLFNEEPRTLAGVVGWRELHNFCLLSWKHFRECYELITSNRPKYDLFWNEQHQIQLPSRTVEIFELI